MKLRPCKQGLNFICGTANIVFMEKGRRKMSIIDHVLSKAKEKVIRSKRLVQATKQQLVFSQELVSQSWKKLALCEPNAGTAIQTKE